MIESVAISRRRLPKCVSLDLEIMTVYFCLCTRLYLKELPVTRLAAGQ